MKQMKLYQNLNLKMKIKKQICLKKTIKSMRREILETLSPMNISGDVIHRYTVYSHVMTFFSSMEIFSLIYSSRDKYILRYIYLKHLFRFRILKKKNNNKLNIF